MREHRSLTACEHGSHPVPLNRQISASDGVHASMDSMQATARHTVMDCAFAKPEVQQLKEGDNPMLPGGDSHDEPVCLPASSPFVEFPRNRCGFSTIAGV